MPTLGEVELQEKNTDKVPLLNTKPSRPKALMPQNHEHIHEMGCEDKCRPEFFGRNIGNGRNTCTVQMLFNLCCIRIFK